MLAVVGHSGNDVGLMNALINASKDRPDFPIYWIGYDSSPQNLSPMASTLLEGGNKFFIHGGASDNFFADLMEELKLGAPDWVRDPIKVLKADSEKMTTTELSGKVKTLIDGFRARVSMPARR